MKLPNEVLLSSKHYYAYYKCLTYILFEFLNQVSPSENLVKTDQPSCLNLALG